MNTTPKPPDSKNYEHLISLGSELAGGAVGGALGFLAGDATSSVVAAMTGVTIAKSINMLLIDITNRQLSHREEVKVGAVLAFALEGIRERLENGQVPREDGFFSKETSGRTNAEEILEGVLLKSKNAYEEKKIKLLGNFYANLSFNPGVSAAEANHLLNTVENLTYRQIITMFLLYLKEDTSENIQLRSKSYKNEKELSFEIISLLEEILDMNDKRLIQMKTKSSFLANPTIGLLIPNQLTLTNTGKRLISLLGVHTTIFDERENISDVFQTTLTHLSEKEVG